MLRDSIPSHAVAADESNLLERCFERLDESIGLSPATTRQPRAITLPAIALTPGARVFDGADELVTSQMRDHLRTHRVVFDEVAGDRRLVVLVPKGGRASK